MATPQLVTDEELSRRLAELARTLTVMFSDDWDAREADAVLDEMKDLVESVNR